MSIKVLLVEDSEVLRKAIRHLFDTDPAIELVGEAVTLTETIQLAGTLKPDVVILDLHVPNENDVTPLQVKSALAGTRLLTMSFAANDEARAISENFGAVGFLDKLYLGNELIPAIKQSQQPAQIN